MLDPPTVDDHFRSTCSRPRAQCKCETDSCQNHRPVLSLLILQLDGEEAYEFNKVVADASGSVGTSGNVGLGAGGGVGRRVVTMSGQSGVVTGGVQSSEQPW